MGGDVKNLVCVRVDEERIALYEAPFFETFKTGDKVGVLYNQEERVCEVVDSLRLLEGTDVFDFVLSSFRYKPTDELPRIVYRVNYTPMVYRDRKEAGS